MGFKNVMITLAVKQYCYEEDYVNVKWTVFPALELIHFN